MSSPNLIERLAPVVDPGRTAKLLPWMALLVRLGVGLGLLNAGLTAMSSNGGMNPGWNGPRFGGPGQPFESVFVLIPYLEIGIGVGLTFGVFTTLMAILAWILILAVPLLMTIGLIVTASAGVSAGFGFGRPGWAGMEAGIMSLLIAVVTTPCFALLLALSPLSINTMSIDALMFQPPKSPFAPVDRRPARDPAAPVDVEPIEPSFPPDAPIRREHRID